MIVVFPRAHGITLEKLPVTSLCRNAVMLVRVEGCIYLFMQKHLILYATEKMH